MRTSHNTLNESAHGLKLLKNALELKTTDRVVTKIEKFDRELTLWLTGLDSGFEGWNRSFVSFMTCVQNLRSIELDMIGFCIEYRS